RNIMLSFVDLCCHLIHLYLHSFPTRRSSDLFFWNQLTMGNSIYRIHRDINRPIEFHGLQSQYIGLLALGFVLLLGLFLVLYYSRSEEHTSELQSRENLVCRLLLEKKKNNKKQ